MRQMAQPKGLNGETVWAAKDVPVGSVSAEDYDYGRRGNRLVTVNIRVERLDRPRKTVTHKSAESALDFSITTGVWNLRKTDILQAGATVQPLRDLVTFNRDFDRADIKRLAKLERWHLNALRAGCAHQPKGDDLPRRQGNFGSQIDIDAIAPCPQTGYRWGSAWLLEPLPADFLDVLREIFAHVDDKLIFDIARA